MRTSIYVVCLNQLFFLFSDAGWTWYVLLCHFIIVTWKVCSSSMNPINWALKKSRTGRSEDISSEHCKCRQSLSKIYGRTSRNYNQLTNHNRTAQRKMTKVLYGQYLHLTCILVWKWSGQEVVDKLKTFEKETLTYWSNWESKMKYSNI
jgi:hypothetical protein